MKLNIGKVSEAFNLGASTNQTQGRTKLEQRFYRGTKGNSLYQRVRPLTAAERQGLTPIRGDWKKQSYLNNT